MAQKLPTIRETIESLNGRQFIIVFYLCAFSFMAGVLVGGF